MQHGTYWSVSIRRMIRSNLQFSKDHPGCNTEKTLQGKKDENWGTNLRDCCEDKDETQWVLRLSCET